MYMSALASASVALSIVAWKNGHWRYISQTACHARRPSYFTSVRAVPRPYQAGIMQRLCVQAKTQGIARRSSSVRSPRRREGRDAIGRFSMSSMGVVCEK